MVIEIIIVFLGAFLLGYLIGKKQGLAEGYRRAAADIPLQLRQQSLETGKCMVCDSSWINTSKNESFSRDLDTL